MSWILDLAIILELATLGLMYRIADRKGEAMTFPASGDARTHSVEMDQYKITIIDQHGQQIPACSCGPLLNDVAGHIAFHRRQGHAVIVDQAVSNERGTRLDDQRGMNV
jgi:hypothetical protein